MAAAYDDPTERTAALTALESINSFQRARRKLEPQVKVTQGRKRYVRPSALCVVRDFSLIAAHQKCRFCYRSLRTGAATSGEGEDPRQYADG